MKKIRVLLVEDETHTRRMLAATLSESPKVAAVHEAATFTDAIAMLEKGESDALVTDLQLPDGSGLDIIRRARTKHRDMPILVITVLGTEGVVLDAIAHGADGYLLKGATRSGIIAAFEDLLAGQAPISPAIARHVLKRFRTLESAPFGPLVEEDAPKTILSARETEILRLVGKGLKSAEIGDVLCITTNTVNTHIRNIYRKLEVASRTEAVYEATRMGLLGSGY